MAITKDLLERAMQAEMTELKNHRSPDKNLEKMDWKSALNQFSIIFEERLPNF